MFALYKVKYRMCWKGMRCCLPKLADRHLPPVPHTGLSGTSTSNLQRKHFFGTLPGQGWRPQEHRGHFHFFTQLKVGVVEEQGLSEHGVVNAEPFDSVRENTLALWVMTYGFRMRVFCHRESIFHKGYRDYLLGDILTWLYGFLFLFFLTLRILNRKQRVRNMFKWN